MAKMANAAKFRQSSRFKRMSQREGSDKSGENSKHMMTIPYDRLYVQCRHQKPKLDGGFSMHQAVYFVVKSYSILTQTQLSA